MTNRRFCWGFDSLTNAERAQDAIRNGGAEAWLVYERDEYSGESVFEVHAFGNNDQHTAYAAGVAFGVAFAAGDTSV